jgi:hypothetical protein
MALTSRKSFDAERACDTPGSMSRALGEDYFRRLRFLFCEVNVLHAQNVVEFS